MIYHGDCLAVLKTLPDNSVDSIVTDPPYGLSFMGKKWDYDVPSVEVWAECLRVLKPGGYLLAFAGTRTQHRMAVRIEDAGFEIRDMIAWVYGSGFPKSLDVSKAIDKAGGASPREQSELLRAKRERAGFTREQVAEHVGCTSSSVRDWEEGRARAVGAPVEFIVPSVEYRAKLAGLLGYSADERRLIGAAPDRRGDGTVYGVGHSGELRAGGNTEAARQWQGWGTALKPALEPITVARKPLIGTVSENVLAHGTGALNIEGCRVGDEVLPAMTAGQAKIGTFERGVMVTPERTGRWPANLIHDGSEEVLAGFPGDAESSAARYFYCAKASKADRDAGLSHLPTVTADPYGQHRGRRMDGNDTRIDGKPPAVGKNHHPTVKPTDLMRYLCRLVTPPGGTVLDPYTGSGSTGKAAVLEGFRFLGIEREAEYVAVARARIPCSFPACALADLTCGGSCARP